MTNNPTIDGVSRELILSAANRLSDLGQVRISEPLFALLLDAPAVEPPNALREHCKQCADVVKTWPEWKRNCLGGAPAVERQEAAKCGQCGSTSADTCNQNGCGFLESGNGEPEVAALQSTIARLEARIAELESGRGEPIGFVDQPYASWLKDKTSRWATIWIKDGAGNPSRGKSSVALFTAPPAPVAVVPDGWKLVPVEATRQMIRAFIAGGCSRDSYRDMINAAPACLDATAALNGVKS